MKNTLPKAQTLQIEPLTRIFKNREKLDKTLVIVCGAATVVMIVLIALLIAGNL